MKKKLNKNSIYLKPINKSHIDKGWLKWITKKSVYTRVATNPKNFNKRKLINYIKDLKKIKMGSHGTKVRSLMFAVYDSHTHKYFGNLRLNNIDFIHKHCSYGRLVGENDYKNKGYGRLMLYKICELAFEKMRLNKVFSYVYTDNKESVASNKKFGMKIEGFLKKHNIKNKKSKNLYIFSIFKDNFKKIKKNYQ